ncbi:unnamed protein product, partial [Didymodactylos carnosus]
HSRGAIVKPTHRYRRRQTPLTPDVLAMAKLRRPEHIKSSIVQRIEELKLASILQSTNNDSHEQQSEPSSVNRRCARNNHYSNPSPIVIDNDKQLLVTCQIKNEQERDWIKQNNEYSAELLNSTSLKINEKIFRIRSIEYLNDHTNNEQLVRFHLDKQQEEQIKSVINVHTQTTDRTMLPKCFMTISTIT